MNYSLHPEAETDLREAAAFYRLRAGNNLSQSLLAQFEQSVNILWRHPAIGAPWHGGGRRRYLMKTFPYSVIYTVSARKRAAHSPGFRFGVAVREQLNAESVLEFQPRVAALRRYPGT